MQDIVDALRDQYGVRVSPSKLQSLLSAFYDQPDTTEQEWKDHLLPLHNAVEPLSRVYSDLFLSTDIALWGEPCLEANPTGGVLKGKFLLQVNAARDITKPERLECVVRDSEDEEMASFLPSTPSSSNDTTSTLTCYDIRNGLLYLTVSDGKRTLPAVELSTHGDRQALPRPGSKILVKDPDIRMGNLILDRFSQFVGGRVPILEEEQSLREQFRTRHSGIASDQSASPMIPSTGPANEAPRFLPFGQSPRVTMKDLEKRVGYLQTLRDQEKSSNEKLVTEKTRTLRVDNVKLIPESAESQRSVGNSNVVHVLEKTGNSCASSRQHYYTRWGAYASQQANHFRADSK